MSHLFETIKILDGEIQNLFHHNHRCNQSRRDLYNATSTIDLDQYIKIPKYYQKGLVKCRISFAEEVKEVQFVHYSPRIINSIKLVKADALAYAYKFEDRNVLKSLFQNRQGHSEILIIKNGFLTDCFYYNIALLKEGKWYTPKTPLLKGTKRAQLIIDKKIEEVDIRESGIKEYQKISLFNALNEFGEIELDMNQVY